MVGIWSLFCILLIIRHYGWQSISAAGHQFHQQVTADIRGTQNQVYTLTFREDLTLRHVHVRHVHVILWSKHFLSNPLVRAEFEKVHLITC